jgi:hypothetical protein
MLISLVLPIVGQNSSNIWRHIWHFCGI